jgi:AcrR family transcriptional regulator
MEEVRARRFQRKAKSADDQAQLRERFIEIGKSIVAEHPEAEVSLRRVAELAGYAPSALYKYFPTKADLVYAIKEDFLLKSTRYAETRISKLKEPAQRLCVAFESIVEFWSESPGQFRCVYSFRDKPTPETPQSALMISSPITIASRTFSTKLVTEFFEARGLTLAPDLLKLLVDAIVVASLGVVAIPIGSPSLQYSDVQLLARTVVRGMIRSWSDFAEFVQANGISKSPAADVWAAFLALK